jgi:hypothetical protein
MNKKPTPIDAEALLKRCAALVKSLPEAAVERTNEHAAFVVADKKFAWFLNNHHGDGIVCICVKVDPETKETLLEMDPEKYLRPAYISRFGWLSIRLDRGTIDWTEIGQRLTESYRIVAPKRLTKAMV